MFSLTYRALINAIYEKSESDLDRLVRAVQQYAMALRYWQYETLALSLIHVAMGTETLREIALQRLLRGRDITVEALAEQGQIGNDLLDGCVLFTQLTQLELQCSKTAKALFLA